MSDILGLSHLIFSSQARVFNEYSVLSQLFQNPEFYSLDNYNAKKDHLRIKHASSAHLTVYNSIDGSLPSLEFMHSDCEVRRPIVKYGMLFPCSLEHIFHKCPKFMFNAKFAQGCNIASVYLADDIPSLIALSPELDRHSCTMGIWFSVPSLDATVNFLTAFATASLVSQNESYALLKVKAMDSKFTDFMLMPVQDESPGIECYDDDIGFASFGWLAKSIPMMTENFSRSHSISPEFDIQMKNKIFRSAFLYDNKSQSHEVMAISMK